MSRLRTTHLSTTVRLALIGLAAFFAPAAGLAQPHRVFTPPPPMPAFRPPTFTPSQPITPAMTPQPFRQQDLAQQQFRRGLADFQHARQDAGRSRDALNERSRLETHGSHLESQRQMRASQTKARPVADPAARPAPVLVKVTGVEAGSQAGRLGLRKGDGVVSYAGEPVRTREDFQELIDAHREDRQPVSLVIRRGNKDHQLNVRPGRIGVTTLAQQPAPR